MWSFIKTEYRWLSVGFLLTFTSCFGQTYFISLFGDEIRETFSLTHGQFGEIYMIATLMSAFSLFWLGKLADIWPLRRLVVFILTGLAAMCLALSQTTSAIALLFVLFGLRLFGQGMPPHLASTVMARWFAARRGLALSISGQGMSFSEAIMPSFVVLLGSFLVWRDIWIGASLVIILLLMPLLWSLLRQERIPQNPLHAGCNNDQDEGKKQWTRPEALKSWVFYLMLLGLMCQSAILTAVFFHQIHIVETQGWNLQLYATSFSLYAGSVVVGSLFAGELVDRFRAYRMISFVYIPQAGALILFSMTDAWLVIFAFMTLSGISQGMASVVMTAVWAELFGTRFLGSIKAAASSAMVFGSSLGPPIMGWMIDADVDLKLQFLGMSAIMGSAVIAYTLSRKKLRQIVYR